MSLITKKRVQLTFFITLSISLLSLAVPVYLSPLYQSRDFDELLYVALYANFYLLFPLLTLSLFILVIQNFRRLAPFNAIKEVSFLILLILLSALIVYAGLERKKYQANKLKVTIANTTDESIKHIRLHGRNALTEIDSLSACSDTAVIFRGKMIDRKTENYYENEISLRYYYHSRWSEQPIASYFGNINGPFKLAIHGQDSVTVSYLDK